MTNRVVPDRYGVINIGKLKENLVTEVALPAPGFEGGSYVVLLGRPKEEQPYPVSARHDGSNLVWTVQTADTAIAGMGKLECRWYGDNGEVAKSQTYMVRIADGLPDPTEAPEAWEGFIGQVARNAQIAETAAGEAKAGAQAAKEGAEAAQTAAAAAENAKQSVEALASQVQGDADKVAADKAEAQKAAGDALGSQQEAERQATAAQKAATSAGAAADRAAESKGQAETARTGAEAAQTKAEEAAQGVAADREQIGANKSGLEAAQQELTATKEQLAETKATLATTQADLKKAQRAIQFQAELNKGQTWDFEMDTQEAYQRQVPSGAKAGAVMEWGGKTRRGKNVLPLVLSEHPYNVYAQVSGATLSVKNTSSEQCFPQTEWFELPAGTYCAIQDDPNVETYLQLASGDYSHTLKGLGYIVFTLDAVTPVRYMLSVGAGINFSMAIQTVRGSTPDYDFEPYTPELLSALVDEVRVANAAGDSTNTYPIPSAVRNLPGYGWSAGNVDNTVERTENGWQYVQRVGSVDLGTLDWYDGGTGTSARRMVTRQPPDNVKIPQESSALSNLVCPKYEPVTPDETWTCVKEGISLNKGQGVVLVYDSAFAAAESLAAFKAHITGVPLYYELATPITTDITALMGDSLAPFAVEAGGSITMHHPKADEGFAINVPANIQYITKLSEVSANG